MVEKNITINELAGMVKTGFDEIGKQFEIVKNRLTALERGQEDIKLRLGQFAFNIDVQEVKRKMELLEKHCYAKK